MNALAAAIVILASLSPVPALAVTTYSQIDPARSVIPAFGITPINPEFSEGAFMRLREYTLTNPEQSRIGPNVARLLGLEVAGLSIPTKYVSAPFPDGTCYFSVSLKPNTDDIIIIETRGDVPLIMYLTNSKLELRAALVNEPGHPHLITNERVAARFRDILEFWTEAAKTLPSSDLSPK